MDHTKKQIHENIIILISFSFLGFVIYFPSLNAPFYLDDYHHIVNNPLLTSFRDIKALWLYEPARFITHLSFTGNIVTTGYNVVSIHITSIVIHVLNALLLFNLCKITFQQLIRQGYTATTCERNISLLAALLFLVHPLHSQTVIYISQRATLLATMFYFISVCSYLRFQRDKKIRFQIIGLTSCIFAMSCKEISITIPIALLLLDFMLFSKRFKERLRDLTPYLLLLLLIPLFYRYHDFKVSANISQPDYFITQICVAFRYLTLLFLPLNLRLEYDYPVFTNLFNTRTLVTLTFFISLFLLGLKQRKKYPLFLASIIFFLLALSPDSSFIALNDVIFEHRSYLPSALLFCFISQFFYASFKKPKFRAFILLSVITLFSIITFSRALEWATPIRFHFNNLKLSPHNERLHLNLGHQYLVKGEIEEAKIWFQRTLKINPFNARAHNNLGIIFKDQRKFQEAEQHFHKASEVEPELAHPHFNLGLIYHERGDYQKALTQFRIAKKKDIHYTYAYLGEAQTLLFIQDYKKGHEVLDEVIRMDQSNALAHYLKGKIFTQEQEWQNSITHFQLSMQSKLIDLEILALLAKAYGELGDKKNEKMFTKAYRQATHQ